MKYLLDTHIFLWSLNNDKRLKDNVKEILINPENIIYVSVSSAWEIGIKLETNPDFKLKTTLRKAFAVSGFGILPISFEHTLQVGKLPLYHKDPFDRILIAQAKVENLILISSDEKIWKYKQSLRDKSLKQSLRDKSLKQSLRDKSLKQSLRSGDLKTTLIKA